MVKIQVTLFDKTNKYRPISTLIEVESLEVYNNNQQKCLKQAVLKIAAKRYLTVTELKKEGYTSLRWREYTPERLERDKKKNELKRMYEAFKQRQQQ